MFKNKNKEKHSIKIKKHQTKFADGKKTIIHNLNPLVQFIITLFLIIFVFISPGIFPELILVLIVGCFWILAKMNKKTTITLIVSVFIMFIFLFAVNWVSLKTPGLAIYDVTKIKTILWKQNDFTGWTNLDGIDGGKWAAYHSHLWGGYISDIRVYNGAFSYSNDKDLLAWIKTQDGWNYDSESSFVIKKISNTNSYAVLVYKTTWYCLTDQVLSYSLNIVLKILLMVAIVSILVTTVTTVELTWAIQKLISPLKYLGAPTVEWAMTISLAIRFVPSLLQESQKILNAQASRGVDFTSGNIKAKGKALTALIIPMFSIAFIKSNDLAAAMDARSYNPRWSRTQFRYYGNKKSDLLALFLMSMIFGLLIILCFSHIYISIFSFTDILLTQGSN